MFIPRHKDRDFSRVKSRDRSLSLSFRCRHTLYGSIRADLNSNTNLCKYQRIDLFLEIIVKLNRDLYIDRCTEVNWCIDPRINLAISTSISIVRSRHSRDQIIFRSISTWIDMYISIIHRSVHIMFEYINKYRSSKTISYLKKGRKVPRPRR